MLVPVLTKMFDKILWSKDIVVPIHKKGSKTDVNNYRPITLLNHSAKLFSAVINTRLMKLCEDIEDLTRVVISYDIYETSLRRVS